MPAKKMLENWFFLNQVVVSWGWLSEKLQHNHITATTCTNISTNMQSLIFYWQR